MKCCCAYFDLVGIIARVWLLAWQRHVNAIDLMAIPYGQKIKTVEKAGSYPSWRSLAACRPLRFFGAIKGAFGPPAQFAVAKRFATN
jgi:hypothetical protein